MTGRGTRTLTRSNHYVAQTSLRRWSADGDTVFARRLLVSHPAVPEWQRRHVRGLGYQEDLYTSLDSVGETDALERWFSQDFEGPAAIAIDRVAEGARLSRDDWHALVRLYALQDLRTPTRFFEQMNRWDRELPGLLQDTLQQAIGELERGIASGNDPTESLPRAGSKNEPFADLLNISIEGSTNPTPGPAFVRVGATLGRKWWLASIEHLLRNGTADRLLDHKWTIAEPADDGEWPLTDHPALKLHWMGPTDYHFDGGWGRRNADLALPLTPRHLLFTEVGKDSGRKVTFTQAQTDLMRRFLIERARHWIFAKKPLPWVERLRPRIVDEQAYSAESALWARWSDEQLQADRN